MEELGMQTLDGGSLEASKSLTEFQPSLHPLIRKEQPLDLSQVLQDILANECEEPPETSEDALVHSKFSDLDDFLGFCACSLRGIISGEVQSSSVLPTLKPHLDAYPSLVPLFLEEVQMAEYQIESENTAAAERFLEFMTLLHTQSIVPLPEIRERLEQETLLSMGLSDKGSNWDTRYVRTKTKWFFKLQKFNLYREEPEGFAELIDLLDQASSTNYAIVSEKIMELAGKYDLDVYRVVETILTAACFLPHSLGRVLLCFCDNVDFEMGTLINLLGVKFRLYGQKNTKQTQRIRGLCQFACFMVGQGSATWNEILPNVPLTKAESELHWKEMFDRAAAEDKVINTRSLAVKEKQNSSESTMFEELTAFFEDIRNSRVELATVMLQSGMYYDAIKVINEMPQHYATTFQPLAVEIGKVSHYIIDPLYRSLRFDSLRMPDLDPHLPTVINDQLPAQIVHFSELEEKLEPWLMLLGSNLIYDRPLLTKLLRMSHEFIATVEREIAQGVSIDAVRRKVFGDILHLMEHCFLPALTRGLGSSALSEMIYGILRMLPYNIRYTLYQKLKVDYYQFGHPVGAIARSVSIANAKWFQKRVNKDNFKFCGRLVAKDMANNAIIVCSYLTERIVVYDNFGTMITDAMRSASVFAADIMLYSVLEYMSVSAFQKHDAMTIKTGYRFIAVFCATFAKKQPVDVEPIVEYVVGMLKSEQTVDLLVLKEIVHKLSGIEVSEGVTDEQLEALAGGEVLKSEGAYFSPMRNTKRSSIRLKEALLRSNQALPLCLLISHTESNTLYREDDGKNLKLVGIFYDMCHDTLVQYGTFLATNLSKKEYAENFPSLADLIHSYKMPFETSIFLLRSVYWNEIMTKVEEFRREHGIPDGPLDDNNFKLVQQRFSTIFDQVISSVVDLIAPVMIQAPMEDISLRFYVLFWFLSLYDLYVPEAVYGQEIEKLQQVLVAQPLDGEQGDREDREAILALIKRKKEKERATTLVGRLKEEMSVQRQHVKMLKNHLAEEKDRWFHMANTKTNKNDVVSQFLQMCVLPRSTFSTIDALFSAHFISCLHELRTLNFSTLLCYDRMLCDITTALTCCSENEASRYGRLLNAVLQAIMRWHKSKTIFDAECHHHPGFVTRFRTPTAATGGEQVDHIDYENFRHVCHKWHFKLTKSMVSCLEAGSYIRIRNGLIVLDRVLPFYPLVSNFYLAVEKRVQQLMANEKEKRPDLYTLAYGYMGRLRNQKPILVMEAQFHHKAPKKGDGKGADEKKDGDNLLDDPAAVSESKSEVPNGLASVKLAAKEPVDAEMKSVPKRLEGSSRKADPGSPKPPPSTPHPSPTLTKAGPAVPPKARTVPISDVESGDESVPSASKKSRPVKSLKPNGTTDSPRIITPPSQSPSATVDGKSTPTSRKLKATSDLNGVVSPVNSSDIIKSSRPTSSPVSAISDLHETSSKNTAAKKPDQEKAESATKTVEKDRTHSSRPAEKIPRDPPSAGKEKVSLERPANAASSKKDIVRPIEVTKKKDTEVTVPPTKSQPKKKDLETVTPAKLDGKKKTPETAILPAKTEPRKKDPVSTVPTGKMEMVKKKVIETPAPPVKTKRDLLPEIPASLKTSIEMEKERKEKEKLRKSLSVVESVPRNGVSAEKEKPRKERPPVAPDSPEIKPPTRVSKLPPPSSPEIESRPSTSREPPKKQPEKELEKTKDRVEKSVSVGEKRRESISDASPKLKSSTSVVPKERRHPVDSSVEEKKNEVASSVVIPGKYHARSVHENSNEKERDRSRRDDVFDGKSDTGKPTKRRREDDSVERERPHVHRRSTAF